MDAMSRVSSRSHRGLKVEAEATRPSDSFAAFCESEKLLVSAPMSLCRCIRGDRPSSFYLAIYEFRLAPRSCCRGEERKKKRTVRESKIKRPRLVSCCLGCRPAALLSLLCRTSPALLCRFHLFITFRLFVRLLA